MVCLLLCHHKLSFFLKQNDFDAVEEKQDHIISTTVVAVLPMATRNFLLLDLGGTDFPYKDASCAISFPPR